MRDAILTLNQLARPGFGPVSFFRAAAGIFRPPTNPALWGVVYPEVFALQIVAKIDPAQSVAPIAWALGGIALIKAAQIQLPGTLGDPILASVLQSRC